jgi:ADP-ribosylglycohydrolase
MTKIDTTLKVLGGMLSSAIGDAVGEPAFFYPENKSWKIGVILKSSVWD